MASKSTEIDWDEVLLTKDPKKKEIEVSFKRVDGNGFFNTQPGTPPGATEDPQGCTNTVSVQSNDTFIYRSGELHWVWLVFKSVPAEYIEIDLAFSDGANLEYPDYNTQFLTVEVNPGSYENDGTGFIGKKVSLSLGDISAKTDAGVQTGQYFVQIVGARGLSDGDNTPCFSDILTSIAFAQVANEEDPLPEAEGGPIPGDNPECGDASCLSWSAYVAGGYDGPNGWASKVARLYKTDAMYQAEGAQLLTDDPAAEGKVYTNLLNGPTEFYAVDDYESGNTVPTEGMGTINFATTDIVNLSDFIESRTVDDTKGGICDKIYVSKTNLRLARKDLDFGLDGANSLARTNRNYGESSFTDVGYGFISGIDKFQIGWDGTQSETDIPLYAFPGSFQSPVSNQVFLWHRRFSSFFVGGREIGGRMEEPSNVTVNPDNSTTGTPIEITAQTFRVRMVTFDSRRDDFYSATLDMGNATINIYKDEIVLVSGGSSNPDQNKFYSLRMKNPDTDGTAKGWYSTKVDHKLVVSGPFVPENTFYQTEWRINDVSTVSIYKNGRVLVADVPYGSNAVQHLDDFPTTANRYTELLDRNTYGFSGYRNDDATFDVAAGNPGVAVPNIQSRPDSDSTYLMYYEGPDALELPRSDFGQRFLRQFEEFIQPGYCQRIP